MLVQEEKQKPIQNSASCEKTESCKWATPQCYQNPKEWKHVDWTSSGKEIVMKEAAEMICKPNRRWMYCHGWKSMLGMIFSKKLGVYIMPNCPHCGEDLEKYMEQKQ